MDGDFHHRFHGNPPLTPVSSPGLDSGVQGGAERTQGSGFAGGRGSPAAPLHLVQGGVQTRIHTPRPQIKAAVLTGLQQRRMEEAAQCERWFLVPGGEIRSPSARRLKATTRPGLDLEPRAGTRATGGGEQVAFMSHC